jgi:hypothetical protein
MAKGRAPVRLNPTKFLNSKRRVIGMTVNGKYAARTAKGGLVYNPKAAFVKSPGGTERAVANSSARVPTAIRRKEVRKVRKNRGMARGAYAGVKMGMLPALFSPKMKRGRGRPRKHLVSPGPKMGLAGMKLF